MATTIDPRFMGAARWTAETSTALSKFGVIPILTDPEDWRSWATFVSTLPAVSALHPPRPVEFATWDAWAHRFNEALRLL
jgi:hypothetical protein